MDNTKALVFDIQRFSLQDGPGIRTTVFLKGCPLRCAWCHNPESWSFTTELSFDEQKCEHCHACVDACPSNAHIINVDKHHAFIRTLCDNTGACVEACPNSALKLYGYDTDVDSIMEEVIKDRAYYDESGGGLTISGGEPMSNLSFTTQLLHAARAAQIATCLDTSGFAPWKQYDRIKHLVDVWHIDYKATGAELHKELIGVDRQPIIDNLHRIHASGARIILRCPLVHGVNDSDEHFHYIADISNNLADMTIEFLPYHVMGEAKRDRIGQKASHMPKKDATEAIKTDWRERYCSFGGNESILTVY